MSAPASGDGSPSPRDPGEPVDAATRCFDRARLVEELHDPASWRPILFDLLHQLPRYPVHLRASARRQQLESLSCFARRLAMLCSSLLAFDAAEAAERLRFAAEAADPDRIDESLDRLERELARLVRDLADAFDVVL